MALDIKRVKAYAPYLLMDKKEPFELRCVGCSIISASGPSPSFRRDLIIDGDTAAIIEYAYYWDYDIQHLYDLEHVWVYVGKGGEVLDCEASFHGKYFKGMLRDRRNLVAGTHVQLYCQPGKHALAPIRDLYELWPAYKSCTTSGAGKKGYDGNWVIANRYTVSKATDEKIIRYLKTCAFEPSEIYQRMVVPEGLYRTWEELWQAIPIYMAKAVNQLT